MLKWQQVANQCSNLKPDTIESLGFKLENHFSNKLKQDIEQELKMLSNEPENREFNPETHDVYMKKAGQAKYLIFTDTNPGSTDTITISKITGNWEDPPKPVAEVEAPVDDEFSDDEEEEIIVKEQDPHAIKFTFNAVLAIAGESIRELTGCEIDKYGLVN
jgi:hypothetical protein